MDPIITAEIEVTEALLAQSKALRSRANPRRTIAAAQWEIKLQKELDNLKLRLDTPEQAETSTGDNRQHLPGKTVNNRKKA